MRAHCCRRYSYANYLSSPFPPLPTLPATHTHIHAYAYTNYDGHSKALYSIRQAQEHTSYVILRQTKLRAIFLVYKHEKKKNLHTYTRTQSAHQINNK